MATVNRFQTTIVNFIDVLSRLHREILLPNGHGGWPMEWRWSEDGRVWADWQRVTSFAKPIPYHGFYQVRIFMDGDWNVSPIESWLQ
jgi:hypothetical protein